VHALVALTLANGLDLLRRPATLILACVGALLIVSLRWFAAFGLGYEVVQLQELAVYTIGLLGALAVALFWMPGEEDSEQGEALLLARPVSPWVLAFGAFAGRALVIALLCVFWVVCIWAALALFKWTDPRLFGYRGATSVVVETLNTLGPVTGQLLATLILLALVQPVARFRRPVLIAVALAGFYLVGYTLAAQGGVLSSVLPDLARHDVTPGLWGTPGAGLGFWHVIHACAWCGVGIAFDSGILTRRTAS
jgi:hypothetical protein